MGRFAMLLATMLPVAAAGEAGDIRGPKPPIEIPASAPGAPWAVWAALGLLAVALAGGWLAWRRRRRVTPPSPEERARRELDRLGRDGAAMAAAEFAAAASGVLRLFIERRFGLAAPRRTTEEFLHEVVAGSPALGERADVLRAFLRCCDLAKFAGEDLDKLQREDLLVRARGFVNEPPRRQEEVAA